MSDITLTGQERAALEALWRAGGEMALGDLSKELRSAFVELDVKGATLMVRQRRGGIIVGFTAEGRKLAVDLFTPPLTMPTSEEAVKVWLQARGLWHRGDDVLIAGDGRLGKLKLASELLAVVWMPARKCYKITVIQTILDQDTSNEFRAEFDRVCKIARALNANKEE